MLHFHQTPPLSALLSSSCNGASPRLRSPSREGSLVPQALVLEEHLRAAGDGWRRPLARFATGARQGGSRAMNAPSIPRSPASRPLVGILRLRRGLALMKDSPPLLRAMGMLERWRWLGCSPASSAAMPLEGEDARRRFAWRVFLRTLVL